MPRDFRPFLGWCLCLLVPAWAAGAGAQTASPSRVEIEIADECRSARATNSLRSALRARLDETRVVLASEQSGDSAESSSGGSDAVRLRWRRADGGDCQLSVTGAGTRADEGGAITLASTAEPNEIRNAASRIAWLLAVRERPPAQPTDESEPSDSGSEDESTSEEETEATGETQGEQEEKTAREEEDESERDDSETDRNESDEDDEGDDQTGEGSSNQERTAEPGPFEGGSPVRYRVVLVPGVADASADVERPVPAFAVNIIGRNYALRGAELGLLFNSERRYADGVQMATVGNWVSGPSRGMQTAAGLNVNGGNKSGLAMAGVANVHGGLQGISTALGGNLVLGDAQGLQLALGGNWTTGEMSGMQTAALNVAGDVGGFQAGLLNVGRRVEGFQMGVVNVAKRSDVSLGLVNINWDRPAYMLAWGNEMGLFSMGVQHGSEHFQNVFRFGYQPFGNLNLVVPGGGFGLHFPMELFGSVPSYLDFDLLYNFAYPTGPRQVSAAHWPQVRMALGFRFTRRLGAYIGTSLNGIFPVGSPALQPPPSTASFGPAESSVAFWPGFFAGVRF